MDDKVCASCGRRMQWRAKWARTWDEVKYCSDACRKRGVTAADAELEATLRKQLAGGPRGAIVEVPEGEPARRAARRLVAAGVADIVQKGRVVDPSTARGPIGIRRR
ncbi:DUF2256 domain-containing protein [Herbiconiux sp. P15]|uniref:DUF2256 domain-containing protein n=1 Tax=Herbiconiux liukaitaii TaxID=3342799 RepID=UPI0035B9C9DD